MAYTTTDLITKSWYLSGIVARELETVDAAQITDGLDLLNALLSFQSTDTRAIPYYQSYTLNLVINQEQYFVPGLLQIDSITFLQSGVVRFSMIKQGRKQYFGSPRVNNITSLPFNWHPERTVGGMNFYVYFLPADTFPVTIFGKFALSNVALGQDLQATLDNFYIEYLRYKLARYMCDDYTITFAPEKQKRLDQYEAKLIDISPFDLSQQKFSTLSREHGINWAFVNFPGWVPS